MEQIESFGDVSPIQDGDVSIAMLVFGGVIQFVVLNFLDILRLLYFYTTESLKKFLAHPFLPLHPKNTCFLSIRPN